MDNKQEQDAGQSIDVRVSPVEPVDAPAEEQVSQVTHSVIPNVEAAENTDNSPENSDQNNSSSIPAADNPIQNHQNDGTAAASAQSQHKSGAPIVTIVAAILVAIGLAAITVYAYMQQQPKTAEPSTTTQSTTPTVSEDEVNQADADVDEALKSADEVDFVESELTDQSLGL